MADKTKKWDENKPGKYYVDDQCIDCDACRTEAPENFTRNDDNGYSFVVKQPESDEEIEKSEAALEACPVEAIGKDGGDSESGDSGGGASSGDPAGDDKNGSDKT